MDRGRTPADLGFGASDTAVEGIEGDRPTVRFTHEGQAQTLECDFVIGADGSRTYTRFLIPQAEVRVDFFRQYPFAWFGILAEAPPSSDELIYAHSERGFALISTRSPNVQRHYFQCDPNRSRHATPVLALNNIPVIDPRAPLRTRPRQQRLDHLPLLISQLVPAHHKVKIRADHPDLL